MGISIEIKVINPNADDVVPLAVAEVLRETSYLIDNAEGNAFRHDYVARGVHVRVMHAPQGDNKATVDSLRARVLSLEKAPKTMTETQAEKARVILLHLDGLIAALSDD